MKVVTEKSDFDSWMKRPSLGDPKKVHAIGAVTIAWGECQLLLAGLSGERNLSDVNKRLIDQAQSIFEVCRQNRNRYAHAITFTRVSRREDKDGAVVVTLGLLGEKRGYPERMQIRDSVSEIRAVAEEIERLGDFMRSLTERLERHPGSNDPPDFVVPQIPVVRGQPHSA